MAPSLDVYLTAGSTYTYLTSHTLEPAASATGVQTNIKPFYLGEIFNEIGSWPFQDGSSKARYMWRDIDRIARGMDLAPSLPAPYPAPQTTRANRVLWVTLQDGHGLGWLRASYHEWFHNGRLPGEEDNLVQSLTRVGYDDPDAVLSRADADDTDTVLRAHTDEARAAGIFGAPTFKVGDEIFWGQDRMETALDWAEGHAG